MSLFQKTIVSKYLKTQNQENIHLKWESFKEHFHNSEIQNNIRNSKEEEYQEGFLRDLFVTVLGYTLKPQINHNLYRELKNVNDSKKADGGIIITASHNPKEYNALKLLRHTGEFLNASEGARILELAEADAFNYSAVLELGSITELPNYVEKHIQAILDLPLVNVEAIRKKQFKVAIDCVNSVGGIALPPLLKALGVEHVVELYCDPTGHFPHNPEPLPENLTEISSSIKKDAVDVGFVVDPDVDRLAIVSEDGSMFGEE